MCRIPCKAILQTTTGYRSQQLKTCNVKAFFILDVPHIFCGRSILFFLFQQISSSLRCNEGTIYDSTNDILGTTQVRCYTLTSLTLIFRVISVFIHLRLRRLLDGFELPAWSLMRDDDEAVLGRIMHCK